MAYCDYICADMVTQRNHKRTRISSNLQVIDGLFVHISASDIFINYAQFIARLHTSGHFLSVVTSLAVKTGATGYDDATKSRSVRTVLYVKQTTMLSPCSVSNMTVSDSVLGQHLCKSGHHSWQNSSFIHSSFKLNWCSTDCLKRLFSKVAD